MHVCVCVCVKTSITPDSKQWLLLGMKRGNTNKKRCMGGFICNCDFFFHKMNGY